MTLTAPEPTGIDLLSELEQVVAVELDRHLGIAKEWFPHEYVPWSRGRDFDGLMGGEAWRPEESGLTDVGRISLTLNLLTEDNLPSYHFEIANMFGRDGAWGTWVHRWTAEEGRHGIAIRDYLMAARAVDPVALERSRMEHMENGYQGDHLGNPLHVVAYVTFQELATRVSHRNSGRECGDPLAEQLLSRIATDENLHMVFYRNLLKSAFELAPDQAMRAVTDMITGFRMPGHGMTGFERASLKMAVGGVYNLRIHLDDVLQPVLRNLKVMERTGFGPAGEQARDELGVFLALLEDKAAQFDERLAARKAREAARRA
ncbi:MAG: acyl-ACP desaturase [Streptomycetaceae bacterium]|uniref:Acyl-ACP desaturase n=1 Tax=Yinghuangia aomiensis TaxID=676205 RepID=A0ABP9H545_9ACTN|nr:acyl-ACP desaturase [Streptomycetaceae bacterium]NUS58192.1 acyl-ACP desaturase [Streptomycetaceae bacterium]